MVEEAFKWKILLTEDTDPKRKQRTPPSYISPARKPNPLASNNSRAHVTLATATHSLFNTQKVNAAS